MVHVSVAELREIANNILYQLEDYDDDDMVYARCNTYGMMTNHILEVDEGFIDYDEIRIEEPEDGEESEW